MMRTVAGIALFSLVSAMGCTSEATAPKIPSEADGLRLDGSISAPILPLGQTAVLTFRLKNLTEETIRLDFGSGCQVTPFIEHVDGRIVDPRDGSYACLAVLTSLTLAPHGEHVVTRDVFGGQFQIAIYTAVPLPKGRYRAYAMLEDNSRGIELRSTYVEFEVR